MTTKRTLRLAVVASLAAASTVAITTWLGASAELNVVRLHLGTDATRFSLGSTVQNVTVGKNNCAITQPQQQSLMVLASSGNRSAPGLANYGLGVKASPSSGNGSPCAQIDSAESLTLRPGTSLGNRTFEALRLDLEMTGDAVVELTLSRGNQTETYTLLTGHSIPPDEAIDDTSPPYVVETTSADKTDACASPNSSGPNSAGSDNCQWHVTPSINFDTITLSTTVGTVTLEGGADFGNNPDYDTLFYLSNAAPTAANDSLVTNEDTPVPFDVRANDTDGDGDDLTASPDSQPTHGTLTQAPDGVFTYTPDAEFSGIDTFDYTVSDGTDTSGATVTITVNAVNDAPVAVSSTPQTPEEQAVDIVVGTDIDSAALTAGCTAEVGAIVDNGDGSITFTPPLDFNGSVTVTCTITDDHGDVAATQAIVTVGVTPINDAPAVNPDTADVNQNRSNIPTAQSVLIPVLTNDTDVDLDVLSVGSLVTAPAHGTAAIEGGSIRYTPTIGYTGPDTFSYKASDGQALSNVTSVQLTVVPVMCSADAITDTDDDVTATFVRLTDFESCKRYTLDADALSASVLFKPVAVAGDDDVKYRGVLSFGPEAAPGEATGGALNLLLEYDPLGGTDWRPVQWCNDPVFDGSGDVTDATPPTGETWCIASETTQGQGTANVVTEWQVFGIDDPRFQ